MREREDEIHFEISNKLYSTGGNQTVYNLMKRYIDIRWKDVRESTQKGYITQLKFMKNAPFGKKKIKNVSSAECPRSCCRVLWDTAVLKSPWMCIRICRIMIEDMACAT